MQHACSEYFYAIKTKGFILKTTNKLFLALLGPYLVMGAGSAFADSTTMNVSAKISGICKFAAGPYAIPFGTLDPASSINATKFGLMSYRCTHGTVASSINIGPGAGSPTPTTVLIKNGTYTLPVSLVWLTPTDIGAGFGGGVLPIQFKVTGTILASDIQTAVAGTYISTYPITLLP
jgi:hypothetical protein